MNLRSGEPWDPDERRFLGSWFNKDWFLCRNFLRRLIQGDRLVFEVFGWGKWTWMYLYPEKYGWGNGKMVSFWIDKTFGKCYGGGVLNSAIR
jgi:hypothetical protein